MRIAKWPMRPVKYDYKVHFQRANENVVTSALSRLPVPDLSKRCPSGDNEKSFNISCRTYLQFSWGRSRERHVRCLIFPEYFSASVQVGISNNNETQLCLDGASYEKSCHLWTACHYAGSCLFLLFRSDVDSST